MRSLTPWRPGLIVAMLVLGIGPTVCFGHGEGCNPPPPPQLPPGEGYPVDDDPQRVYPPRWSWLHWWEANRDPYLRTLAQNPSGQRPAPDAVKQYRDKAVRALLAATSAPGWEARSAAALALGRMNEASAIDVLTRLAGGDADGRVRVTALVALGLLDLPQVRDGLLAWTFPTDPLLEAGCAGLGLLRRADDARVLDALQRSVGGRKAGLATVSAWGLRRRPDPDNLRFLGTVLVQSRSPWLVSEAILALGEQGDPSAVPLLADILLAGKTCRGLAVWVALERYDREIQRLAREKARLPVSEVQKVRQEYKKNREWSDDDGPNGQDGGAAEHTWSPKIGIEQIYMAALRASAAIALGRFRTPEAQAALLAALDVRDDGYTDLFKGFALMSLGPLGDEKILPPLLGYLAPKYKDGKRKTMREVGSPLRGYAALALGLYARPRASPQGPADPPAYDKVCEALAERLADRDEQMEVRAAAVMGLGLTGRTECLRLIHRVTQAAPPSEDLLVGYTLLASAMVGDRNILEPARRFLAAANEKSDTRGLLGRRAAVLGLGLLGLPETVPILIDAWHLNYHVNREVAVSFALGQTVSVTDPLVDLLLKTQNPLEQAFAARCLGELFSAERPTRLAGFLNENNYAMKNLRLVPFQALANEFLYTYLIPCFGDQWL